MTHLKAISKKPLQAQTAQLSVGQLLTFVVDMLTLVSAFMTTKEVLPDLGTGGEV
jgi:hypothetical protein